MGTIRINFNLENKKNEKKSSTCWVFSSMNQKEHCTAVKSILEWRLCCEDCRVRMFARIQQWQQAHYEPTVQPQLLALFLQPNWCSSGRDDCMERRTCGQTFIRVLTRQDLKCGQDQAPSRIAAACHHKNIWNSSPSTQILFEQFIWLQWMQNYPSLNCKLFYAQYKCRVGCLTSFDSEMVNASKRHKMARGELSHW